jgi:hypothetical protein
VEEQLAPDPGVRRKSNEGYRKRGTDDRLLLFFMRLRRNTPFEGLGILFGIATSVARDYYLEILNIFHEHLVPLLLAPLDGETLLSYVPEEFKEKLPGAKVIIDLTSFKLKSKANAAAGRILYSAYHHQSEAGAVFGEILCPMLTLLCSSHVPNIFQQLLLATDCSFIAPNSLEGSQQKF